MPTSSPGQALEASAPAVQETRASTGGSSSSTCIITTNDPRLDDNATPIRSESFVHDSIDRSSAPPRSESPSPTQLSKRRSSSSSSSDEDRDKRRRIPMSSAEHAAKGQTIHIARDATWYVAGAPGRKSGRAMHLVYAFTSSGRPIPWCRHKSMTPLRHEVSEFGDGSNPYSGAAKHCTSCMTCHP